MLITSKKIFTLVVMFCLALSAIPSRAQVMCDPPAFSLDKIAGEVVSNRPRGYEPISQAKVELFRIGGEGEDDILVASSQSEANGRFEIGNIKKGRYRLEVSKYESGFMRFILESRLSRD